MRVGGIRFACALRQQEAERDPERQHRQYCPDSQFQSGCMPILAGLSANRLHPDCAYSALAQLRERAFTVLRLDFAFVPLVVGRLPVVGEFHLPFACASASALRRCLFARLRSIISSRETGISSGASPICSSAVFMTLR